MIIKWEHITECNSYIPEVPPEEEINGYKVIDQFIDNYTPQQSEERRKLKKKVSHEVECTEINL